MLILTVRATGRVMAAMATGSPLASQNAAPP